jgi:hypothetical protein
MPMLGDDGLLVMVPLIAIMVVAAIRLNDHTILRAS